MSKYVVKNGILTFGSTALESAFYDNSWCVNNVTIDISAETVNYLCMGNNGWTDTLSSTKSAEFSWETALDDTIGVDLDKTIGREATLTFDTVDGLNFSALVVINSISIGAPVDDVATVSWTATCNGEIGENVS